MADFNRPLASAGVAGHTILNPGPPRSHEMGVCEWMAPKRPPAPIAERTTSGMLACSFEMYQYFADWLTRLSMVRGRKSPNMISKTGRLPQTALPNAAPARASSEIGVSRTRSGYFSHSRGVTAKTPPAFATSSPKKMTDSSRASSSSSASRMARRNSISAILELPRRCIGLRERRGQSLLTNPIQLRAHVLDNALDLRLGDAMLLDQPAATNRERVFQAPTVQLTLRPVLARVAAGMANKAIGQRLDEARAIATARRLHRLPRGRPHHPQVVAVQGLRWDLHRQRARDDAAGGDRGKRRVLAVAVVLADINYREVPDFCEVEALVEIALVGGAVTEKGHGHVAGAAQRQAGAGGRHNAAADDAEAADQPMLQVDDVH